MAGWPSYNMTRSAGLKIRQGVHDPLGSADAENKSHVSRHPRSGCGIVGADLGPSSLMYRWVLKQATKVDVRGRCRGGGQAHGQRDAAESEVCGELQHEALRHANQVKLGRLASKIRTKQYPSCAFESGLPPRNVCWPHCSHVKSVAAMATEMSGAP